MRESVCVRETERERENKKSNRLVVERYLLSDPEIN